MALSNGFVDWRRLPPGRDRMQDGKSAKNAIFKANISYSPNKSGRE
jgi:hypothetical protein